MLEGIRDQLPLFIDLLYDQQPDHWLLENAEGRKKGSYGIAREAYLPLHTFLLNITNLDRNIFMGRSFLDVAVFLELARRGYDLFQPTRKHRDRRDNCRDCQDRVTTKGVIILDLVLFLATLQKISSTVVSVIRLVDYFAKNDPIHVKERLARSLEMMSEYMEEKHQSTDPEDVWRNDWFAENQVSNRRTAFSIIRENHKRNYQ